MDWLKLITYPFAWLVRGTDGAIINRYVAMLEECERRCEERDAKINALHRELVDLRRLVVVLEEQRLHGMLKADASGTIIFANPAIAALCDCSVEQLLGKNVTELIPYRYRHAHHVKFMEVAGGQRPLRTEPLEATLLTMSGREIPVTIRLTQLSNGGHPVFGADIHWR
jgi:PAS domain S-box-containing protein